MLLITLMTSPGWFPSRWVIWLLCVKSVECHLNIRGVLLHLSSQQASCWWTDPDVWILGWGEAEQPGCYRSHGLPDPRSGRLFGLVTVSVMVDQVKQSSGLVTNCCGPELDQRMGELQWRTHTHCSTSKKENSEDKGKEIVELCIQKYSEHTINKSTYIIWSLIHT